MLAIVGTVDDLAVDGGQPVVVVNRPNGIVVVVGVYGRQAANRLPDRKVVGCAEAILFPYFERFDF